MGARVRAGSTSRPQPTLSEAIGLSLFEELQSRNVFRVGIAYLAFAWLIVQIGSIVFPAFDVSNAAQQALIIAFALGFPIVLVCAWVYEITPDGLKRSTEVTQEDRLAINAGRRLDFVIIGVLTLALVGVVIDQYVIDRTRYDAIAVLPFANLSGDPDQEYFADGMTDQLIANLGKVESLDVVSRTSVMRFKDTDLSLPEVAAELGANVVVEASVLRDGDRVQIIAKLIDGVTDRELWNDTLMEI